MCQLRHSIESLQSIGVNLIDCPVCGHAAVRRTVNRIATIMRPAVDTRGMFRRFQEASAEIDHAAVQIEADTGQPVRTPSLWPAAKARANAIEAAGENPYQK